MYPVARRICDVRKQRGLTQEEVAALANISPQHYGIIERGVKIPTLGTFAAIANALEVSADTLLQDVVDKSHESVASDLSQRIAKLPSESRTRILAAIKALIDE